MPKILIRKIFITVYEHMCIHMRTCMYVRMYASTVCMCVCIHVRTYVCMHNHVAWQT